ncbi:MAG: tetratricopeptide repeat protein, partial [Pirellulaceae bacterium]
MELAKLPHYGIVSGNRFRRAPQNHDSGAWIEVVEADRLQALRWMAMAEDKLRAQPGAFPSRDFYRDLVHLLSLQRSGRQAWLLQHPTDLKQTPEYTDTEADKLLHSLRYAPVDATGQPVLYQSSRDWKEASSDGERLRWALDQWKAAEPVAASLHWIDFLRSQLGVATLVEDRWFLQFQSKVAASSTTLDPTPQETTGIYALHTLTDRETIAHLANGVRRFPLADEFNPIRLLRQLIQAHPQRPEAYHRLIEEYTNRRQYPQAAEICRQAIRQLPTDSSFREILGNIIEPRGR